MFRFDRPKRLIFGNGEGRRGGICELLRSRRPQCQRLGLFLKVVNLGFDCAKLFVDVLTKPVEAAGTSQWKFGNAIGKAFGLDGEFAKAPEDRFLNHRIDDSIAQFPETSLSLLGTFETLLQSLSWIQEKTKHGESKSGMG